MGKKPFIDRKQAKHYHVVHRSQKDPLVNDDEASQRVLREVVPSNMLKHKTKEELAALNKKPVKLSQDEIDQRVGKAALYGIYFDDSEYDYTQHLKPIGATDAVFLEAPAAREKTKPSKTGVAFRDELPEDGKDRTLIEIPADVLPSEYEMKVGVMNQSTGLDGGLQPDMDPRLREVLEALEDEEFIDEDLNPDDFFTSLDADGEVYVPEDDEEEYDEEEEEVEEIFTDEGNYDWQAAFRNFKREQQRGDSDDEDFDDDDFDDRQSKGTGFSVSSSMMHRNTQLRLLDDRFDKIEEEYMEDEDEDEEEDSNDEAFEERGDFDSILDEFLEKYELVGKKMEPKLEGETSGDKLDTIRRALFATKLEDNQEKKESSKNKPRKEGEFEDLFARPEQRQRDTWDVQSVLSTYSNLENHPQMISDRGKPSKKIRIDPKTGLPCLVEVARKPRKNDDRESAENGDDDEAGEEESDDEDDEERVNLGVARSKKETKEEKKARKLAVKEAKKVS
ncbi:Low temperature viability protein-domain-containing protein [Radiomyces spectabilis]|uniref:Low temperature viability protein-domain-containing protein n=1 Tax=Radiomyces spectabilis TaxID=64574 RepID=UPI00221F3586|nr:Low temperature viability protein-domain-containing protein [Radiomyces spectabilis]KAI8379564.1 Low temperature viability protein-domain-containing protein [Radiomyces spectabilis]